MRFVLASLFSLTTFAATPAALLNTAPIRFEPRQTGWISKGLGYSIRFGDRATTLRFADRAVTLTFPGSNRHARFHGSDPMAASTNYFIGSTYARIPAYRRLRRDAIYPGIDVVYYGHGGELEYDFEIAPGADPSRIRMRFEGADAVSPGEHGSIVLKLGDGSITQRAPVVYQKKASGEIAAVEASYRIDKTGAVRVRLSGYDPSEPLIVDPAITYSAYLAGSSTDLALAIGHDSQGNIYLAGNTWSNDFPATGDTAYQGTYQNNQDVWVMKVNPANSSNPIVYSTYLGGGATETLKAMAVDANGVVYLTGSTNSGAYPVTPGALTGTISSNTHAFVTMLDPSQPGSAGLIYSTYLGGGSSEEGDAIAVANGKIYITGFTTSDDFPVNGAIQPTRVAGFDGFVAEFDPTQSGSASLVFSTYLGGSGQDLPHAIAVDSASNVYVAGVTYSNDFPATPTSYQPFYNGNGDGFLTVLNPGAGTMPYSTMLGGASIDDVKKIVIEPGGHVALAGYTLSSDFPVSKGAYQTDWKTNGSAFLTILDLKGTTPLIEGLVYSTWFGGTGGDAALDLRRDSAGRYVLGGYTFSLDLPVTPNALNSTSSGAGLDGFVAVIDPAKPAFSADQLVYSSYVTGPGYQVVYGVDVDSSGAIYATGAGTSNLFPSGAAQNTDPGKMSGFLLVFTLP